jgi:hypothetical protein
MGSYTANLPTLTIDAGFASSSVLTGFEDASALIIMGPATLTGTCTVRVAKESDGVTSSSTWADYQSGGSDVTITSGGNAVQFTPPLAGSLILVSAASEAALRVFQVQKRFSVGGA